jgi:predicted glycoside hydrolase/deacetylase ChbG (UPF0249 family)
MSQEQGSEANRMLGYPADTRLLIINADDLGMCHAVNAAILRSLEEGIVHSTTLMVPCPWALHAMQLLAEHPDIPFGIHLTLISDTANYRWGPRAFRDRIPSLVDESGFFYLYDRIPELLAQAKPDEVEAEFRAQIGTVLGAGLTPTHLDWHCLFNGGRPDIFELTVRLAKEYGLAIRAFDPATGEALRHQGLPANEHSVLDSYRLDTAGKSARFAQLLRDLPAGLNEWAVHPGLADAELIAIHAEGAPRRQADFDFVISEEARAIIQQEGITLLSYKPIQEVWREQVRPG